MTPQEFEASSLDAQSTAASVDEMIEFAQAHEVTLSKGDGSPSRRTAAAIPRQARADGQVLLRKGDQGESQVFRFRSQSA